MGFLRRSHQGPVAEEAIPIGVHQHRLVLKAQTPGLVMLGELEGYIGALSSRVTTPRPDGTDSVALQSAKLDLADMVEDWTSVAVLAMEELREHALLDAAEMPERPPANRIDRGGNQYTFIQAAHQRAEQRLAWLSRVDALLRERGAALLPPAPPDSA